MTQSSLIARLKKVEEALEIAQDDVICSFGEEPDTEVRANLRRDVERIEAALTDLRDLIREAEGQSIAGVTERPSGVPDEYLYTALGEKP